MIWAIVLLGALLLVAAAVTAIVSPVRTAVWLVATGVFVAVAFVALAVTSSGSRQVPMGGFPHAQLEADRIMTQQMANVLGPGMESQMSTYGMLQRSSNEAYLRALEQHAYQVDRMLGRAP